MNRLKKASTDRLVTAARAYYKRHARRGLPWRRLPINRAGACDPYKILVSEVMLQQTQVERVVPFYRRFVKKFPNARSLAQAKLSAVLRVWQGLGYNRRAKYLRDAAKVLAHDGWTGQKLPGVGPYTMGAVEAFAFNRPVAFVETNIRTALLHHFPRFHLGKVSDATLLPLVAEALKHSKMPPREFCWVLMDYGAYLKKSGVQLNYRSKHYVKQSKFEGSRRQKRAAKLRKLLRVGAKEAQLLRVLNSK